MNAPAGATTFHHILCWVDGSHEACRAAERAAHLARCLTARLSFVAVGTQQAHDQGFEDYARIEGVIEPIPPSIAADASACLDQAMLIATKICVTSASRLVQTGDPATAICDAAQTQGADLVVIRRRRSGLIERLLALVQG